MWFVKMRCQRSSPWQDSHSTQAHFINQSDQSLTCFSLSPTFSFLQTGHQNKGKLYLLCLNLIIFQFKYSVILITILWESIVGTVFCFNPHHNCIALPVPTLFLTNDSTFPFRKLTFITAKAKVAWFGSETKGLYKNLDKLVFPQLFWMTLLFVL